MVLETTILPLNYTCFYKRIYPDGTVRIRPLIDFLLSNNICNLASTNGSTTLTDSETKTLVHSYRYNQLYSNCNVITWHYHFATFWKSNFSSYVSRSEIELR